jgi:hypothetical protein
MTENKAFSGIGAEPGIDAKLWHEHSNLFSCRADKQKSPITGLFKKMLQNVTFSELTFGELRGATCFA